MDYGFRSATHLSPIFLSWIILLEDLAKKKKKVPLPERHNNLTGGTGNENFNKRTSPMFHFPTAKNTTKVGWLGLLHRRILGSQSPNKEQSTAEDVQTPPYEMLGPNYKCCSSFSFINLGIQLNIAWRKNSIDLVFRDWTTKRVAYNLYWAAELWIYWCQTYGERLVSSHWESARPRKRWF